MDAGRTSPRKTRSPSPRRRILHRDPFNLSFSNTTQHNEGTHRSQRQYFIPQKEIIKDWTPRDLTARRAFLATYAHYNNTRDPGFVCPELENSWKARAGVEGASYSHQVHVYRRYMADTGRIVGVADSARAGSTPFASACTQVGQRIIADKPAHQYCNDGRGTGTFHASNGLIHYNAENPSLIAKMGNKQSCGHDHSPIRHDTYVKAHERETFAHNATLIPWKQNTLGKSIKRENYPEDGFSGSMDNFPSVSRHGSARTNVSDANFQPSLNQKKEAHVPVPVHVDGGENGVKKDDGATGDVNSVAGHREEEIDHSSPNAITSATTTTTTTTAVPGTPTTATITTPREGSHNNGMDTHAGTGVITSTGTVARVRTHGPTAGRRAIIGNNHAHSGKIPYFPENPPVRGLRGGVDGRGDPRDWEPDEYGRYHPLYARSVKASDGMRVGTRRSLTGTGTGTGMSGDGRKGHMSNGSNVNSSDGGRRVRRERTGIELGWAKSRGKIPDDGADITTTSTSNTTTTIGTEAGTGTAAGDVDVDDAAVVTGNEHDTSAAAGADAGDDGTGSDDTTSGGKVKKIEENVSDEPHATAGDSATDSGSGNDSGDGSGSGSGGENGKGNGSTDGIDADSKGSSNNNDNNDKTNSESPLAVAVATNEQEQEHISSTTTTTATTTTTPASPPNIGNRDVHATTDATEATTSSEAVGVTTTTAGDNTNASLNPDDSISTTSGISADNTALVTNNTNDTVVEANDGENTSMTADDGATDASGDTAASSANDASTAIASHFNASNTQDANASGAIYHDKNVDNTQVPTKHEPEVPPQEVVESVDTEAV